MLIQCDKSRDPFSHAPIQGNAGWHQAEVQRASTLGTMWDMFIVRAVLTSEIVAGLSFNLGSNFMEKVIYLASLFMLFFSFLVPFCTLIVSLLHTCLILWKIHFCCYLNHLCLVLQKSAKGVKMIKLLPHEKGHFLFICFNFLIKIQY